MISSFFHYLSRSVSNGSLITHRSDDELAYLLGWLDKGFSSAETEEPVAHEVDSSRIKDIIQKCARCAGAAGKKMPFGSGSNGIMIILNLPDKVSAVDMKQYRAAANELMKKMMGAISVRADECYITSMIKCQSERFARPSEMFSECAEMLKGEISEAEPKIVIVMGAMSPLMRMSREFPLIRWFTIDHPVTLIKNPDMKRGAWNTLLMVKKFLESGEE
jgi:uracil-DNA glycosylase family 4